MALMVDGVQAVCFALDFVVVRILDWQFACCESKREANGSLPLHSDNPLLVVVQLSIMVSSPLAYAIRKYDPS